MDRLDSPIWIWPEHWDIMCDDVAQRVPEEACGLVAGKDRHSVHVFPLENVLHSPVAYRGDPHEQLRVLILLEERQWDLLAIYHSHPDGPATPSLSDLNEAAYPEAIHLIWSRTEGIWGCRGFLIQDGVPRETPVIRLDETAID